MILQISLELFWYEILFEKPQKYAAYSPLHVQGSSLKDESCQKNFQKLPLISKRSRSQKWIQK